MAVCPVECISFISDEEGFFYPTADHRCTNCGRCEKVCPIINESNFISQNFKQFCVAALHKDTNVWRKSSSGGAFSAICKAFCNDGDAIFGAKFEGFRVVHDFVYGPDNIESFRKSKYVQSDIRDSYNKVKNILESNKKVLFSGTPCQVAGLRSFLGKEYKNLLFVDLVCHGVGSPGVFKKYIEYLEKRHASKVISYTFRHKKAKMGRFLQHIIIIKLANGKRIEDSSDLYNNGFIQTLFLRPSCGKCIFANLNRL